MNMRRKANHEMTRNTRNRARIGFLLLTVWLYGGLWLRCGPPVFASTTDTFTASGTWTDPAGITSVDLQLWGGGGGGGGGRTSFGLPGSGGGGGAYSQKLTISVTPGNNYTVTVGTGGTGGLYNT